MYRFNLESLLNYRCYQEEILQKELANFKNQLVQHEKILHQKKQNWRKYSLELHQKQRNGGTIAELILYFRYLDRLSMDIDHQKRCILAEKKQIARKHRELIEIIKKRKILEKLKRKGLFNYQQQTMKKERDHMDEAAATRCKLKNWR